MATERTLSILKPDATRRNLTGKINAYIEAAGLRIIAQKPAPFGAVLSVDHPLAERSSITVEDLSAYALVATPRARGRNSIVDQEIANVSSMLKTQM